jgi:magnesium-transporting ATPase (P-type)
MFKLCHSQVHVLVASYPFIVTFFCDTVYAVTHQVLYNNFVPISMYVTVEIVVFIQVFLLNNDRSIYSAKEDMPAKVVDLFDYLSCTENLCLKNV